MTGMKAILFREYKLLVKNRVNLILGIVPPAVYIAMFATSISNVIPNVSYENRIIPYKDFIIPAIMLMSMLAGATTSAASIFQEEMGGMILEIWSHPVRRASYVAGKLIATTGLVLVQGLIMLIAASIIFNQVWPADRMLALLTGVFCTSLALNGLYLYAGTYFRDQQRFLIAINVAAPVLTFGSPSFYPRDRMPLPLQAFSWIDPITYGIYSLRDGLLAGFGAIWAPIALLLVLAAFTIALTSRSLLARFGDL